MTVLTIIRYPKYFIPFALVAMAIHRLPLLFRKSVMFYKLMGCGKNGGFDKHPDWQQWAIFSVHHTAYTRGSDIKELYGTFINSWIKIFAIEACTIYMEPIEGHGSWDGNPLYSQWTGKPGGVIAVLTRASIRFNKVRDFWQNVPKVSAQIQTAPGLLYSTGIGEVPLLKQATFSTWNSIDAMKNFSYKMQEHIEVIKKTRERNWYAEEMFIRYEVVTVTGTINGVNPMEVKP